MLNITYYLKKFWEAQSDEFSFVNYEEHFDKDHLCNIYMIGTRPRICIDPNYMVIKANEIELKFRVQRGFSFDEEFTADIPKPKFCDGEFTIETAFPYSDFDLLCDGKSVFEIQDFKYKGRKAKSFYALRYGMKLHTEQNFTDLEIHYIGKSLKMHKTISAVKRMASHKHTQQILGKCSREMPDHEVYIMLCSFVRKINLVEMSDKLQELGNTHDEIMDVLKKYLDQYNDNIDLTTSISEAALIDYFNTSEFNSDYIDSFGSKKHGYYKNLINAKIDRISLEVDFSELGVRTYSTTASPKLHHLVEYFPFEEFRKNIIDI